MLREGARVKFNAYLRDMNVNVRAADERRIEVLAQDLPCLNGVQLAIDITLRGHEQRQTTADETRKRSTQSLCVGGGWLCWPSKLETGGAMKQLTSCGSMPKHAQKKCFPPCLTLQPLLGKGGGPGC